MTDSATRSPAAQVKEDEDRRNMSTTQHRICDFCGEGTALLYCRADSAKLCFSCDLQVHSTNPLFTKHTRSQLCDACDSTPASILCSTENSVLCQNCDWERHNQSLSSLHERRPLEGFTGCPCVNELLTLVGFEGLSKKDLFGHDGDDKNNLVWSGDFGLESGIDGYSDLLVWDTPSIVTLDDLIGSNNSERTFQAMGVPPLPKNRKAAGGKYKEEILAQLRKMAKSETNFSDGHGNIEPPFGFHSLVAEQELKPGNIYAGFERGAELDTVPSLEACAFWCNDTVEVANQQGLSLGGSNIEENCLVPDKDSDFGGSVSHANRGHEGQSHHCIITETPNVLPKVAPRELTSQERDSAISRYKEKKKARRYDKHVRYESRRIRAEHRVRIKGRFAKME